MSRHGKCSVLLVNTPDDWRPSSHHSTPTGIVSARFYRRRVTLREARAITDAFNREAFRAFAGTWCLCTFADPAAALPHVWRSPAL